MPRFIFPISSNSAATSPRAQPLSETNFERVAMAWGSSGNPYQAAEALQKTLPLAKQFRDLFAGISLHPGSVWACAVARAEHLASWAWERRLAEHAIFDAKRVAKLVSSSLNLRHYDSVALAHSEPSCLTLTPARSLPLPGAFAMADPPETLRSLFLKRRTNPSWARRLRHTHGSYFMGDPMLLALLRRVEPEHLELTLNRVLLCATLAGGGAQAVMSLGADPMGLAFFESKSAPTNLLGAILRMSPRYLLSGDLPCKFYPARDAILEQSVHLALACVVPSDMSNFLKLLAHGSRRPSNWPEAVGLSAQRGHLRCAQLFLNSHSIPTPAQLELARQMRAEHSQLQSGSFDFSEHSARAWAEFDALAEVCVLKAGLSPEDKKNGPSPRRPRL